jgi:hypothetical protein
MTKGSIEPPEPKVDLIPIRMNYFSPEFWRYWDQLEDWQRKVFVLGWISELEATVRGISARIDRIEEHLEDNGK